MGDGFYSRHTGKFKKPNKTSYVSNNSKEKDQSSVYSLEDDEEDYSRYQMGVLTATQTKYIEHFECAMTM